MKGFTAIAFLVAWILMIGFFVILGQFGLSNFIGEDLGNNLAIASPPKFQSSTFILFLPLDILTFIWNYIIYIANLFLSTPATFGLLGSFIFLSGGVVIFWMVLSMIRGVKA